MVGKITGVVLLLFMFAAHPLHADDFLQIDGPCRLRFPRDHGAHPGYRTEWWYYTGHLKSDTGERFGFQLTFFRVQLSAEHQPPSSPPSAWRTNQIYLAHAALSDLNGRRFYHDEQTARGALDLAGVLQEEGETTVFLGKWSARLGAKKHELKVMTDPFSLELTFGTHKSPVAHGREGYSLKGRDPRSASCYYSFTRLEGEGLLNLKGRVLKVEATGWMDHEFSSAPLEPGTEGWDWFGIQLTNGEELMVYLLRERGVGYSPASGGTFVTRNGQARHLSLRDLQVEVLARWHSPRNSAVYPSRWRIRVPPLGLDLEAMPDLSDQEMETSRSTGVTYWEGSVSLRGELSGKPVEGVGYVEMTGYARPFRLLPDAD